MEEKMRKAGLRGMIFPNENVTCATSLLSPRRFCFALAITAASSRVGKGLSSVSLNSSTGSNKFSKMKKSELIIYDMRRVIMVTSSTGEKLLFLHCLEKCPTSPHLKHFRMLGPEALSLDCILATFFFIFQFSFLYLA